MPNLTIRTRLQILTIVTLAALVFLASLNFYGQRLASESISGIEAGALQPMLLLQELESALKGINADMNGAVLDLTSYIGARQRLQETRNRIPRAWGEFLDGLEKPAENESETVNQITGQLRILDEVLLELEAAYAKEDRAVIEKLLRKKWPLLQKRLVRPLSSLIPSRAELAKATLETSQDQSEFLTNASIVSLVLCVLILLAITVSTSTSITKSIDHLKRVLSQVAEGDFLASPSIHSRDEIGDMSRSLASTLSQLRGIIAAIKETSASLQAISQSLAHALNAAVKQDTKNASHAQQISDSISNLSDTAKTITDEIQFATQATKESETLTGQGNGIIKNSLHAMNGIKQSVTDSSETIQRLSETIDRINEITGTIRGIADQTNLLALNAAIEAARAGDQGRGFAVVADEVRTLASRTAASTSDIGSMVEAVRLGATQAVDAMTRVRSEVDRGVAHTSETQDVFSGISKSTQSVTAVTSKIAMLANEQLGFSEASTEQMKKVKQTRDESRAELSQLETISSHLLEMSRQLEEATGRFIV